MLEAEEQDSCVEKDEDPLNIELEDSQQEDHGMCHVWNHRAMARLITTSSNFSTQVNEDGKPGDWTVQSWWRNSYLPDLQILHENPVDSDSIPRIMLSVRPRVVRYEFQVVQTLFDRLERIFGSPWYL
jgi:hypothetical protein